MSTHGKILYISYDGMTDPLGQSQVLPYLLELSKKGYSIILLSYEKPERYKANQAIIQGLLKDSNIQWKPLRYHKRFSIIATLYDILQGIFFLHKHIQKENVVLVHCRSYISALLGLYSKKAFGTKFLFDMRGFWADERVDGKLWDQSKWLYRKIYSLFKYLEKKYILNADQIISLTHAGLIEMKTWPYMTEATISKIKIIPCCVDLNHFNIHQIQPPIAEELKSKWNLHNSFVLTYLGSIGTWYMLPEMLDFFKTLLSYQPNAKFLFITGDEHDFIRTSAAQKNIPDSAIIIQQAPRALVPTYLSLSRASIFFIRPTYSKISSSPTKMAEIMALGVPIFSNTGVGDVDTQIKEAHAGISISQFKETDYKQAIEQFLKKNPINKEISLPYTQQHFSLTYGAEIYYSIYQILAPIS